MAVLRLDVPLGSNLGWFGFRTHNPAWKDHSLWTLPGYPRGKDSGNGPWLHLNFPIIDDDNDGAGVELEYQADTEGGQSGAPVFTQPVFPQLAFTIASSSHSVVYRGEE
ncbi:hypothetical protein GCM10009582_12530 [Arthrobacter flavus]